MTPLIPLPFDQRTGWLWLDGEFVEWGNARLHVLTHGLHYASSVFEGERAYSGQVFRLEEHTQRLLESARILDFEIPFGAQEIECATHALLNKNSIVDGYIRPIAWRGSEQISTAARASRIHLAIAAWEWPRYFDKSAHQAGISLQTAVWRRPPPCSSPFNAKAASHYMIATLSKHAAERNGFDDALMLDWRGQVAEATSANLFFVRDRELHTPLPDCFLNGITRQAVIALASSLDLRVIERAILPEELCQFDECFLTGTAVEVCPVGRIDDHRYQKFKLGKALANAFREQTITHKKELEHVM